MRSSKAPGGPREIESKNEMVSGDEGWMFGCMMNMNEDAVRVLSIGPDQILEPDWLMDTQPCLPYWRIEIQSIVY